MIGKVIAMSIVQGGSGFPVLHPAAEYIRRGEESVVLHIAVCKHTLQSTKVNVVAVAKSYVIDTTNTCRCATMSDHECMHA